MTRSKCLLAQLDWMKRRMDKEALNKYFLLIFSLYPDVRDSPGKQVLIKIASRPGRINLDFMAYFHLLSFYMYHRVLKTTAVS